MALTPASELKRHPLVGYFVLSYAVTWLLAAPLVAATQGWLVRPVPFAIHYLGSFGPMVAAVVMTALVDGRPGLRDLWSRATRWRIGGGWLFVAVGSPVVLFAAAAVLARLVDGAWPDLARLGEVNFLGNLGLGALLLWLATFGFGEETGWRGFALPRLQQRHSALRATVILAVLWALWHLPAFFYLPTLMQLGVAGVPAFVLGVLLGAVLLTWLYNSTGGSVFAVALWHGLYDFFSASHATALLMNGVMATVVMVWAIGVVVLTGPARLSRATAPTAPAPTRVPVAPPIPAPT